MADTKREEAIAAARALMKTAVGTTKFLDEELVTAEDADTWLSILKENDRVDIYSKAFKEHYNSILLTDENALAFQRMIEPFLITGDEVLFKSLDETRANYTNHAIMVVDKLVKEITDLAGGFASDVPASNAATKLRIG